MSTVPAHLARTPYVRITTFRKDGTPVPTAVWNAVDDGNLVFTTGHTSGKVKRLAHTSRVLVAPCNSRGQVAGGVEDVEAHAVVVTDRGAFAEVERAVKAKYGIQVTLIRLLHRLRGADKAGTDVGVRIRFPSDGGAPAPDAAPSKP